ncbi:NIPSNAP family protein [Mangrovicoccus sp. HB161399]|uniref:NIPSNAP family protein n=1 Tax=Mangrovicoccus sp. HB161399 TaxID=2720392 RepID=UPI001551B934|nr:NIPSNAP family protein [Mangrovicoccus sp. HB161399]
MFHELRVYDLMPGKGPEYLELFRTRGVQHVTRHLPMAGYWLTDTGALNRIYHLWIYASLEERAAARAGLGGDRDWNEGFVPAGFPLIVTQENMLMRCEESSALLDRVVEGRLAGHGPQEAGAPMFGARLLSLVRGRGRAGGELLGRWSVISGAAPGAQVSLFAHEAGGNPFATAEGAERHEILRPLELSPLR